MWKKIAPLLILLSIGLNIAFVGAWILRATQADRLADAGRKQAVWCPLHRALNVTAEQWETLEPHLSAFRNNADAICNEVNRKREEMLDLLAVAEPDRQALADKQEEILACQRKMQHLIIEHLLFEKTVLTSRQQEDFFKLFRERCAGHASPRYFRQMLNETAEGAP